MSHTPINIVSAQRSGAYRLHLLFDDKTVQEVDFEPERFASFKVQYGELVWGDYDLCFPVMDLYHNSIEHHEVLATV